MKIVIVSNYFNHHQMPLAEALYQLTDGNFWFICTREIGEERVKLGYKTDYCMKYVKYTYKSEEERQECHFLIDHADVVIAGSAPEEFIKKRIRAGKLVFRYSERPLKQGMDMRKYIPRLIKWNMMNMPRKNIYMLCASGYTASDYAKFGLFKNRSYKWGYFPEIKKYEDADALIESKKKNSILWVGRFLDWKHPEYAIHVARKLKEEKIPFELNMIGSGSMEEEIRKKIQEYGLNDDVVLLGTMRPEEVRRHMEQAGIFLFTSNRQEGWGVVLSEAMNSGCAIAASNECGSVPFLMEHQKNGMIYYNNDENELYQHVKALLTGEDKQRKLGKEAYATVQNDWNAQMAAQRILALSEAILQGKECADIFSDGICSKCN